MSLTIRPPAAGRERRVDSRLHLVVRQVDVDVEAVASGSGRLHLLEPERRPLAVSVKQVLVANYGVAKHRLPERPNAGYVQGVDRDLHVLHGRRVGWRLQPGRVAEISLAMLMSRLERP